MTWAVAEVAVNTVGGSWGVADITAYASPAVVDSWAVAEISVSATPASTIASFVYSGGQWVRVTPHVYTGGAWQAL